MIHYILQFIVFQLLFLLIYDLLLKKELFFKWNRIYLILSPVLSFILPLIKLDFIRQNIPEHYIIKLPAILLGNTSTTVKYSETLAEITILGTSGFNSVLIWQLLWLIGVMLAFSVFSVKLYKIFILKKSGTKAIFNGVTYINLPKTDVAFSFINSIYLGDKLSEEQKETILLHESIHIKQGHSLDLLFFEVLKILCWFNPLIYIFQNKMLLLQEYIADEKAASFKGKKAYYQGLLSQVFKTESISFINTFFNHSLIKKRIIMLQKSIPNSRSKKIVQLKYLLLFPVIGVMLVYTSCAQEPETVQTSSVSEIIVALKTVIEKEGISNEEKQEFLKFLKRYPTNEVFEINNTKDYFDKETIPFTSIDKVPTYPGCTGTNEELKKCMSQKIFNFVFEEFNKDISKKTGLTGRQRIVVQFKIDKLGEITDIKSKAPHPSFEEEAERVIAKLPKMKPGEQEGKAVGVLYSLPILFEINE